MKKYKAKFKKKKQKKNAINSQRKQSKFFAVKRNDNFTF